MLLEEIERVAKISKSILKSKKAKVLAQFDADGICSAAIIAKALARENFNFEMSILKQLSSEYIQNLQINENDFLLLLDFGSGQLPLLEEILNKTHVLILDHHKPKNFFHMNLLHVNPLLFIDEELSASIISYFFAKFFNPRNADLVDLAVIGAIADFVDEDWQFTGLAKKVLEEAQVLGKISTSKGLRLYGRTTRPLYKSLAYAFDPFIPEISGSESNAIQFLSELGIKLKNNGTWLTLNDLEVEEQQRLASAILLKRMQEDDAENIFGEIHSLLGRPEDFQDAREFATVVNACGRTGHPEIGLRLLLGDYSLLEKSYEIIESYRKMLYDSLNWLRESKHAILSSDVATFIMAQGKIPDSIIGTVTSIIFKSGLVDAKKPIFSFSLTDDNRIKISARAPKKISNINLGELVSLAAAKAGGEGGGHTSAAGAFIPTGKEEEFISAVNQLLGERIGSKKIQT